MAATPIEIKGELFVLLPKAEYERLRGIPAGYEPAEPFMQKVIAADLRQMREQAGLTQAQLARKLRRSQAMVSRAENGTLRVGDRYVRSVARACGPNESRRARLTPPGARGVVLRRGRGHGS